MGKISCYSFHSLLCKDTSYKCPSRGEKLFDCMIMTETKFEIITKLLKNILYLQNYKYCKVEKAFYRHHYANCCWMDTKSVV